MPDVTCVDRKIQEVPRGPSVADLTEIWIRYVFSSATKILHEPIFFSSKSFAEISRRSLLQFPSHSIYLDHI